MATVVTLPKSLIVRIASALSIVSLVWKLPMLLEELVVLVAWVMLVSDLFCIDFDEEGKALIAAGKKRRAVLHLSR